MIRLPLTLAPTPGRLLAAAGVRARLLGLPAVAQDAPVDRRRPTSRSSTARSSLDRDDGTEDADAATPLAARRSAPHRRAGGSRSSSPTARSSSSTRRRPSTCSPTRACACWPGASPSSPRARRPARAADRHAGGIGRHPGRRRVPRARCSTTRGRADHGALGRSAGRPISPATATASRSARASGRGPAPARRPPIRCASTRRARRASTAGRSTAPAQRRGGDVGAVPARDAAVLRRRARHLRRLELRADLRLRLVSPRRRRLAPVLLPAAGDYYARFGWTWIGGGAWGWPTHHYGRWGVSGAGAWFWIPGAQWGPAWVSWAVAPDYVSWCPLGCDNRPVVGWGHGRTRRRIARLRRRSRSVARVDGRPARAVRRLSRRERRRRRRPRRRGPRAARLRPAGPRSRAVRVPAPSPTAARAASASRCRAAAPRHPAAPPETRAQRHRPAPSRQRRPWHAARSCPARTACRHRRRPAATRAASGARPPRAVPRRDRTDAGGSRADAPVRSGADTPIACPATSARGRCPDRVSVAGEPAVPRSRAHRCRAPAGSRRRGPARRPRGAPTRCACTAACREPDAGGGDGRARERATAPGGCGASGDARGGIAARHPGGSTRRGPAMAASRAGRDRAGAADAAGRGGTARRAVRTPDAPRSPRRRRHPPRPHRRHRRRRRRPGLRRRARRGRRRRAVIAAGARCRAAARRRHVTGNLRGSLATYVIRFARRAVIVALFVLAAVGGVFSGRPVRLRRRPAADLRARRLRAEHDHARLRARRRGHRRVRHPAPRRHRLRRHLAARCAQAIIAAEDADFDTHFGVSISAHRRDRACATCSSGRRAGREHADPAAGAQPLSRSHRLPEDVGAQDQGGARSPSRSRSATPSARSSRSTATRCTSGHGAYGVEAASRLYFSKSREGPDARRGRAHRRHRPAARAAEPVRGHDARDAAPQLRAAADGRGAATSRRRRPTRRRRSRSSSRGQPTPRARRIAPYFVEEVRKHLERTLRREEAVRAAASPCRRRSTSRCRKRANRALDDGLRRVDKRRGFRRAEAQRRRRGAHARQRSSIDRWDRPMARRRHRAGGRHRRRRKPDRACRPARPAAHRPPDRASSPKAGYAWTRKTTAADPVEPGDLVEVELATDRRRDRRSRPSTLEQTPVVEGALVAIDNRTGQIRAMVGGYSFERSKFNRAMQAYRQLGSTFKPIVYTAAIDRGYTPVVDAASTRRSPIPAGPGQPLYSPQNYDRKFEGPITLRYALEQSRNVPAVRLMDALGPKTGDRLRAAVRLRPASCPPYLSLALGAARRRCSRSRAPTPSSRTRACGCGPTTC